MQVYGYSNMARQGAYAEYAVGGILVTAAGQPDAKAATARGVRASRLMNQANVVQRQEAQASASKERGSDEYRRITGLSCQT